MTRNRTLARTLIAAGAGVALLLGGTTQAGAATGGHIAGYVAPPGGGPTQTAAVTFVVPTINCKKVPAGGFQAVLAGARLEVPGGNTGGGVGLVCPGPLASYIPFIQIDGVSIGSGITPLPGDTVSVFVSENAGGSYVTLTDGAVSQTASGPGGVVTAEDIGNIAVNCLGGPTCSPVPRSTVTKFSSAAIDNLNLKAAGSVQQNLTDASGAIEISSSGLKTKKTQNAFSTKWVSSCSVGPGVC